MELVERSPKQAAFLRDSSPEGPLQIIVGLAGRNETQKALGMGRRARTSREDAGAKPQVNNMIACDGLFPPSAATSPDPPAPHSPMPRSIYSATLLVAPTHLSLLCDR